MSCQAALADGVNGENEEVETNQNPTTNKTLSMQSLVCKCCKLDGLRNPDELGAFWIFLEFGTTGLFGS